jgi:hypothetical protein
MSRTWDIGDTGRVFSTHDGITRPLAPTRRLIPDASSMVRLAVMMSVTATAAVAIDAPVSLDPFGGTSDLRVVFERSSIPIKRGPTREKRVGIDFARGRSPRQLAHGFKGLFRPAADIDDSSDDGFVFR